MDDSMPPLTVGPDGPDGPLRAPAVPPVARRILLVGLVLVLLAAAGVGALSGSGRSAAAASFIGASLVSGVTALATLVTAVRSEYRGQRVPARRIVAGLALLLAAPVLLILAAGAAGAA